MNAPCAAGVGLRSPHFRQISMQLPPLPWLEVHSENFFASGGPIIRSLDEIRAHYPISLHGVGMGLGSSDALDSMHLAKLKALIQRIEPCAVSEHLCWGAINGRHFNDLLPLPYTEEALLHLVNKINTVQEFLGHPLLIENVSAYLRYDFSTIPEWEFLAELSSRSGCNILLDINNIYVNACNFDFDPHLYVQTMAEKCAPSIKEFHLAGFSQTESCLIDTHSQTVAQPVWKLFEYALKTIGPRPTLVEWDIDLPELSVLCAEAEHAQSYLDEACRAAA